MAERKRKLNVHAGNPFQQSFIDITTVKQIDRAVRAPDIYIRDGNVRTRALGAANDVAAVRGILAARLTHHVFYDDVADGQRRRILVAQRQVALPIALRDLDRVVDRVNGHG